MSKFIYSTLTSGQTYVKYDLHPEGVHRIVKAIEIKGGSNMADKKTFLTPLGVVTEVSDADYEVLKGIPQFAEHVKARFIIVRDAGGNVEAVVADMKTRDESAPLTPNDYVAAPETVAKPMVA